MTFVIILAGGCEVVFHPRHCTLLFSTPVLSKTLVGGLFLCFPFERLIFHPGGGVVPNISYLHPLKNQSRMTSGYF